MIDLFSHPVEKELSKVLDQFVKKAPKETLTQLSQALVADGVLKSSEKENILEKNHTRVNRASCLADTVMDKGPGACKKMIHHLQAIDVPLSTKLGLFSGPFAQQDRSSPEPKPKPASEPGPGVVKRLLGLPASKASSANQKAEERPEECWRHICPEGDSDADLKQWLKDSLEDLDSRELKYFHWFLHTADKSKDGFKPIKKSRLEHADRLDTVDLMFQMYTTNTREVAEKILKKMNKNRGHDLKDWLLDILEELDDRELRYFHWYLYSADKSKDGFKAIKKSRLEGADRLDTVELMAQTYAANTKEVTKKILEKIESSKENVIPEVEEQSNPSSAAAAEGMTSAFKVQTPSIPVITLLACLYTAAASNDSRCSAEPLTEPPSWLFYRIHCPSWPLVRKFSTFIDSSLHPGSDL
ncbi:hypothetical protein XENORESO_000235 [Xenotaenia resolanae]|uniref:Pyrin domain-containing protein n=1 Tax=Xenotaenia resolanae TaxID=208358 RepID=A0ABV0WNT4_9TELE